MAKPQSPSRAATVRLPPFRSLRLPASLHRPPRRPLRSAGTARRDTLRGVSTPGHRLERHRLLRGRCRDRSRRPGPRPAADDRAGPARPARDAARMMRRLSSRTRTAPSSQQVIRAQLVQHRLAQEQAFTLRGDRPEPQLATLVAAVDDGAPAEAGAGRDGTSPGPGGAARVTRRRREAIAWRPPAEKVAVSAQRGALAAIFCRMRARLPGFPPLAPARGPGHIPPAAETARSGPAAHLPAHDQPRPPPLPRLLPEADAALSAHRPGRGLLAVRRRRAALPGRARAAPSSPTWATACGRSPTAIGRQAERLAYVNGTAFTNDPVEEFAAEIARRSPGDLELVYPLVERLGGGRGRAQAGPAVLGRGRRARPSTRSSRSSPAYHGNTLLALSASAREHYKTYFRDWLVEVVRVPAPYAYRCECRGRAAAAARRCSGEALEAAILREGPDTIAAVIAEPVGGSSTGASVPRAGVLAPGSGDLRPARRPAGRRRGADRRRPDRHLVGAGAVRRGAGHHDPGEGHRRRVRPALRGGGAPPAGGRRWRGARGRCSMPRPSRIMRRSARPAWPRCGICGSTR